MEKLQNKLPEVRFPEFEGEWDFKGGNKVFNAVSNKNHNSDLPILAITQEQGAIPREFANYNIIATKQSVSSYKVVEKGDFIISLRSFQGGIEYSNYKGICSPAYIILKPAIDINRDFFKIHFKTFKYIQQLKSKLEGIRDGKMISYKYFSEIKLPFPTLAEQTRIAHFFTVLDKKLNQLKEKKALLSAYKKGMMQKIFSQEIRFKPALSEVEGDENGEEFPKWEVKKLGEVAKFSKGKGISKSDISEIGKYECIRYGELYTHYKEVISDIISKTNIDEQNLIQSKANDVIIPASGEDRFDIATASCILKSGIAIGGDLNIIRSRMNGVFLSFYLNSIKRIEIANMAQGVSVVHLYSSQLSSLKIDIPSFKEQTRIANFLTKIDEKINNVGEQISQTQEWKKGMLQKMFCI